MRESSVQETAFYHAHICILYSWFRRMQFGGWQSDGGAQYHADKLQLFFRYQQDEATLKNIADIRDNHFYLTHIQMVVRRDSWPNQEHLESSANRYPNEYKKIEKGGQDYSVSTSINQVKDSDVVICRSVRWVKDNLLFQINLTGTISVDEMF